MGVEIERKFLVDHEKWGRLGRPEGTHYKQGYLLSNEKETIRVRISDNEGFLNLKSKVSQVSRKEYEYKIPLQDGIEILEAFTKRGTEKTRYKISVAGKTWEVDVFMGDNKGLIVAEIELESEDEKFEKPDWVTKEVTDDGRYTNSSLSINPYKNWGM
ncbi:CYTH domain-containing protein [Mucilaginibacter sp. McL0603]|uniref:CYTH domain-containing protein n=1 Tax=Mucilaginibacter sp. McL0603 TaxID=3415670 RepID=UPI003CE7900C